MSDAAREHRAADGRAPRAPPACRGCTDRGRGGTRAGELAPRREAARRAEPAGQQRDEEAHHDRLPQRRRRHRGPARHRDRAGEQRVGQRDRQRGRADLRARLVTWPSCVIQRPARSISAAGSSTRPSGSRPIRARRRARSPRRGARRARAGPAERSAPASPPPRPTCGAVIQPIRVSVASTASPPPAAASAAMPPAMSMGRLGSRLAARPGWTALRRRACSASSRRDRRGVVAPWAALTRTAPSCGDGPGQNGTPATPVASPSRTT